MQQKTKLFTYIHNPSRYLEIIEIISKIYIYLLTAYKIIKRRLSVSIRIKTLQNNPYSNKKHLLTPLGYKRCVETR